MYLIKLTSPGEGQQNFYLSEGRRHCSGPQPRQPKGLLKSGSSGKTNYRERQPSAQMRLPSKGDNPTTLQRQIQLLYPLEIASECQPSDRTEVDTTPQPETLTEDGMKDHVHAADRSEFLPFEREMRVCSTR